MISTSKASSLRKLLLGLAKKFKFLPEPLYLKIYYEYYTGKKLDLQEPEEFNEKIQWMKLYFRPPILNQLVDKYRVREFVEKRIGAEYLNDLYAVYYRPQELDLDALPDRFVLKGAHGYNQHILVKDKSLLNVAQARLRMRKWLWQNQYYRGGLEWAYKDVTPKVLAERYLEQEGRSDLDDFKFYCFSGKPKFIQVDMDRSSRHKKGYYDLDWVQQPFTKQSHPLEPLDIPKPENLALMASLAEKLATGFPFVRVDFYNISGQIFFGEMTFYPGDGRQEFKPERYNAQIGSFLKLPTLRDGKPIRENPREFRER